MSARTTLTLDLRLHLRSSATYATLVSIVAIAGLSALVAYALIGKQVRSVSALPPGFGGSTDVVQPTVSAMVASQRGVSLFAVLLMVVIVTACLAVGIQTSTSIVGEKERQTYDLLWTTRLRPAALLWSRFLAGLFFGLLLLVAVAPIFSLVIVYGGLPWRSVIPGVIVAIAAIAASAAVGLCWSATAASTLSASILTVCTLLAGLFGAAAVFGLASAAGAGTVWQPLLLLSPLAAVLSTVLGDYHTPLALLLPAVLRASPSHPIHVIGHLQDPFPLWAVDTIVLLFITALLQPVTGAMLLLGAEAGPARQARRSPRASDRPARKA